MSIAEVAAIVNAVNNAGGGGGGGAEYDIIVSFEGDTPSSPSDITLVKWDYENIYKKLRAGELITGYAYRSYLYNLDVTDGNDNILIYPLTGLYITTTNGGATFSNVVVTGMSGTSVAVNCFRLSIGFDTTGAITYVARDYKQKTIS